MIGSTECKTSHFSAWNRCLSIERVFSILFEIYLKGRVWESLNKMWLTVWNIQKLSTCLAQSLSLSSSDCLFLSICLSHSLSLSVCLSLSLCLSIFLRLFSLVLDLLCFLSVHIYTQHSVLPPDFLNFPLTNFRKYLFLGSLSTPHLKPHDNLPCRTTRERDHSILQSSLRNPLSKKKFRKLLP